MNILSTSLKEKQLPNRFYHAWVMISSSSSMSVNILTRHHMAKELQESMSELLLNDYHRSPNDIKAKIEAEWEDFALSFLLSCINSKAYCSTLFNIVPIKDPSVAQKIANEIYQVTYAYPSQFHLEQDFLPLRKIMFSTFCSQIENGIHYWENAFSCNNRLF